MKIVSWNVNSIRVRLESFNYLVREYDPDIILMQETRVEDSKFPFEYFEDTPYNIEILGMKARNGVAILSKYLIEDVRKDFSEDARYISCFIDGIYITNVYVPNGTEIDSSPYYYKLDFIQRLRDRFLELKDEIFIAGGDFNVTPYQKDAWDPKADGITCSPREREALKLIRDAGFTDMLPDKGFTWWDYRRFALEKNRGLRLDHFYFSTKACELFLYGEVLKDIRNLERPSDHAPIICEIKR